MKKIIFFAILSLALSSFVYYLYHLKITTLTHEIYQAKANETRANFSNEVARKKGNTSALTYLISQDKSIINALMQNDRTLLDFSEQIKNIQYFGDNKNLWIQIIDKDGYSFYRSWTDKVGDHAASARLDIAEMIQSPKEMITISTGRFDMTFKTMLPIYDTNQKFLGMVEMISKFNSIANEFKKKDIEPLFILHEDYTQRFIKPFTGLFIKNNYVANLNANKAIMKKVEDFGIKKFLKMDNYLIFEDYLVIKDEIKDIHGGEMGFFFFFIKQENIDTAAISELKTNFAFLILFLTIILILIVLYFLNRNYVKFLGADVEKKTKEIETQKENLSALLLIYDKNVIFSKTDLEGVITHASEAFCKISGYSHTELIGKNHNIVRHPDTPKETFAHLWSELKKKKKVQCELKNRKKDGGFYWVDAEFEPDFDKDGNHIGYSAVRQDITANKEIEEIQKEIIFNMGTIGESRSKETGKHVKRVAEFSKILAKYYGLDDEQIEMIYQASPMHDIGKVAIPDTILQKPSKLNDAEYFIMKTHALKGYEILSSSTRPLLQTAAIIALTHHEKWDGTGYPYQLAGEDIHIYGRITAIVDVFDALGSERCYKEAWEMSKILAFFKSEKGRHFDPKLVDIFFQHLDEFLKIKIEYSDE